MGKARSYSFYLFIFYRLYFYVINAVSLQEGDTGPGADDIFSHFFGGGGPFGGLLGGFGSGGMRQWPPRRGPKKGENTVHRLK